MSAAELRGEQGGSAATTRALTTHEEMLASIERTATFDTRHAHLPLLSPEVLTEGNQRVLSSVNPDEVHKLTIVGNDAVKLDDEPAIVIRGQRVGELLGHMIAMRELVRSEVYIDRGLYANADDEDTKKSAMSYALRIIDGIRTEGGIPLVAGRGRAEARVTGIDNFTVTDIRFTIAYKQARRQAAEGICGAYILDGSRMPDLSEATVLEGAQRALRRIAGTEMTAEQTERYRAVNHITQRMLRHRTEFDRMEVGQTRRNLLAHEIIIDSLDETWQRRAACLRTGPEVFFASGYERKQDRLEREARAKAICRECPVQADCLLKALENREKDGIWGGLNTQERGALGYTDL